MAIINCGVNKDMPAYELIEGKPKPQPSVVSFIDVLCYKRKARDAVGQQEVGAFWTAFAKPFHAPRSR